MVNWNDAHPSSVLLYTSNLGEDAVFISEFGDDNNMSCAVFSSPHVLVPSTLSKDDFEYCSCEWLSFIFCVKEKEYLSNEHSNRSLRESINKCVLNTHMTSMHRPRICLSKKNYFLPLAELTDEQMKDFCLQSTSIVQSFSTISHWRWNFTYPTYSVVIVHLGEMMGLNIIRINER